MSISSRKTFNSFLKLKSNPSTDEIILKEAQVLIVLRKRWIVYTWRFTIDLFRIFKTFSKYVHTLYKSVARFDGFSSLNERISAAGIRVNISLTVTLGSVQNWAQNASSPASRACKQKQNINTSRLYCVERFVT